MICEHCYQKTATVTVTENEQGKAVQHHYCDACAKQFYLSQENTKTEPVSIHQLLANWLGTQPAKTEQRPQQQEDALTCPSCGYTYRRFLQEGKFGCPTCYTTFAEQLPPLFHRMQAGPQHIGAMPEQLQNTYALKNKVKDIRQKMQVAVAEERFEDAAILRDEARAIEEELRAGGVDA